MSNGQLNKSDPRIRSALDELQGLIRDRFPQATFTVSRGEDPDGIYLDAVVDIEDPDQIMDVVISRLAELRVDEGVPIHVLPQRPAKRSLEALDAQRAKWPWAKHGHVTVDPASL
jgi:hypothetical protein